MTSDNQIKETADVDSRRDRLSAYLVHRGLDSTVLDQLQEGVLRLESSLEYWDGDGIFRGKFPAMVAVVSDVEEREITVHRTYLDPTGAGKLDLGPGCSSKKLAPVDEPGATRGSSIKLAPAGSVLALAEGVETALAVMLATGHPCWSCVSASGLGSVELPPHVQTVHIWADNDTNGMGQRTAAKLASRLRDKGLNVFVHIPSRTSADWLDVFNDLGADELLDELANRREWTPDAGWTGIRLSTVRPETVLWLWPGRIPSGKICILDGDPGLGKSTVTLDLAARVTRGLPMPDGTGAGEPAGVVLVSAEDGLADTIVPRLQAAGADLELIWAIEQCGEDRHPFTMPDDLAHLERAVRETGARLVVIDPLMAFLNLHTNAHRDQDTRYVLARVHEMASTTGAAVLLVRHLNKAAGGTAIYRGGGSIGIIGAARSGLLVAKDPEDEQRRVLACTKQNLAVMPSSLAFRLVAGEGRPAQVAWEGSSNFDANALLAPPVVGAKRTERDEVKDFLREELAAGPVPAKEVEAAALEAGISKATLRRARLELGVKIKRDGFQGKSLWSLDPTDVHEVHTCSPSDREQVCASLSMYGNNPALVDPTGCCLELDLSSEFRL